MKRKFCNMSFPNRIFHIFNGVLWSFVMFVTLYPLYLVCISSVSDPNAVMLGKVIWKPVDISFVGYKAIFENEEIWISYANSIFYTITHIVIAITVTLLAAYALSSVDLFGKKIINLYFLVPMFFNGGLIPTFLILKSLGFYDTRLVLILSGCLNVWNLMVARTYIKSTIPKELREAAELDGASHFQYFMKVVMPLSKTIVAVLAVYYGVDKWNNYFQGLVYIKDRTKLPLQTVLRELLATLRAGANFENYMDDASAKELVEVMRIANVSKYCMIIAATFPVIIMYVLLQKYFEKGIMIGSLKG